jgi:UPF0755 protein
MNVEDLLRETLSELAREERPPPPERFLPVGAGRSGRRPLVLASAAAVTALVVGSALVVSGLSAQPPAPRDSMAQDVAARTTPDPAARPGSIVTVPPGLRLSQIITMLSKHSGRPVAEFERAAEDVEALGVTADAKGRLEGYAFPATYEISPDMSAAQILAAMVTRFERAAADSDLVDRAKQAGRTPREVLTVASIVQAESGRFSDMPKVARVIYNRLERKPPMLLQMDSTTMYGLNRFGLAATFAETKDKSPYNTYQRKGLPPGPICNPGEAAIEAALKPAAGRWLWFVTTDPKNRVTKFTDSESEFLKFAKEFHRNSGG